MAGDALRFRLVDTGANCLLTLEMSPRMATALASAIIVSMEGILDDGDPIGDRVVTINAAAVVETSANLDMDRS